MASNKRTIYLGLDYSQFSGGVTEVNRKMGLLDAEFKMAQQQAKNYGNETDVLGLKQDYLGQKIALQQQKVDAAKKAFEDAAQSQNASSKELDNLQRRVLNETTALERMRGELQTANQAQEELNDSQADANEKTKTFGDEIRGLANTLGLSVNPAVEALAKKFDGVTAGVGNAIIGIGAIIGGFVKCSVEAAEFADNLLTLSSTSGIATDELQRLDYASKLVDVSVDTMTSAMTRMIKTMNDSRDGTGNAAEAYKKLHVRLTEANGALRDSNTVFYEVIDALGRVTNETERDALAMEVFGRGARELNPLIEAGSKSLKEMGDEAEKLGVIMGEEDLRKLGKFQDVMDKFESTTQALKNNLGLMLLPILTRLFEVISSIPEPVLKTLVTLASIIATITLVIKAINSLSTNFKGAKAVFSGTEGKILKVVAVVLALVVALTALALIIAVIAGKKDDLGQTMDMLGKTTSAMQGNVQNAQQSVYKTQNHASGTTNFSGGRTWVGEAGPELVTLPAGSQITPAERIGGTTNTYYITIDAKNVSDFNKVVQLAEQQKMAVRRI